MTPKRQLKLPLRWLPLIVLLCGLLSAWYLGYFHYLQFDSFKENRDFLLQWRDQHYVLSIVLYCLIYIICIAISLPGGLILTLMGGFLFGIIPGTLCVIFSATIGATILFLAVQSSVGNYLTTKASPWIKKLEAGFKQNAFHYLLILRLIPLFPFWVVNIIPGMLNVRLKTFISATFIGIIPATVIYTSIGHGLNTLFDTPRLLTPSIVLPLCGLAVLALLPILYRRFKKTSHA